MIVPNGVESFDNWDLAMFDRHLSTPRCAWARQALEIVMKDDMALFAKHPEKRCTFTRNEISEYVKEEDRMFTALQKLIMSRTNTDAEMNAFSGGTV